MSGKNNIGLEIVRLADADWDELRQLVETFLKGKGVKNLPGRALVGLSGSGQASDAVYEYVPAAATVEDIVAGGSNPAAEVVAVQYAAASSLVCRRASNGNYYWHTYKIVNGQAVYTNTWVPCTP